MHRAAASQTIGALMFNAHRFRRATRSRRVALLSALTVMGSQALPAQQVGVSILPTAQRIQWADAFPLRDDYLYGGRVALRFGKWVELQPFYFQRDGLAVDSARANSVFGPLATGRSVDVKHYGSTVQFNLGDAAFVPFARVGAGVLRFEPDSAARQDRITVSAGGGVRFGFAGLNAEIYAEQMGFRMNPRTLFGPDTSTDASLTTLRNLVYGAAVTIPLSTMREDEVNTGGLSGSSAPIEPFVGRLRYDGGHRLPNLEVAGVRAGIDFSQVFGIRGFYWRGVNDDRDGPAPVAGYGGEAQFTLSTGAGLSPYLVVGAGQIDYKDNFADSLGLSRADKTAFILGGGASFRLTDRIRVNGAIRDYIMTLDDDLDEVASTGDLTHNTMLTAGFTISLGGRSLPDKDERVVASTRNRSTMPRAQPPRALPATRDSLQATRDSLRAMRDSSARNDRMAPMRRMDAEGRWITVPVPVQGEVILRYGYPPRRDGRDSIMERRMDSMQMRQDSVMRPQVTPPGPDITAELREIERRLSARIDALQRAVPAAVPAPVTPAVPPAAAPPVVLLPAATTPERDNTPVFQRLQQTRASDLRPYIGLAFDDGDGQFVIGSRADLGPVRRNSGWHFMPELAVGIGGGDVSLLAFANAQYELAALGGMRSVRPYLTLGGGIYSPTVLGLNTAVGSSFPVRSTSRSPLLVNVEVQGINLFNSTRLLVGVRRGR